MDPSYRIRFAERRADYDACVELQRTVWRLADLDVTSSLVLITGVHAGGLLQLAETAEAGTVGFAFAIPALHDGRPHFHSDMVAVLPAHQKHGVGLALKWAQREAALARGVTLITSTYDPLGARNAHLNLRRLGARGVAFRPDFYGSGGGRRSQGPDRLSVRWVLDDPRVVARQAEGDLQGVVPVPELPRINDVQFQAGWPVSSDPELGLEERELLLEIPPEWDVLAGSAPRLADDWHRKVRVALKTYFDRGYQAVDFAPTEEEGRRRPFYVLRRD
jgi:predicted GNAT superfamily acetyltransferase